MEVHGHGHGHGRRPGKSVGGFFRSLCIFLYATNSAPLPLQALALHEVMLLTAEMPRCASSPRPWKNDPVVSHDKQEQPLTCDRLDNGFPSYTSTHRTAYQRDGPRTCQEQSVRSVPVYGALDASSTATMTSHSYQPLTSSSSSLQRQKSLALRAAPPLPVFG